MTILVTGGAGFIGSHTCLALLDAGKSVVVLDNFSNSSRESIRRVEALSGKAIVVEEADLREAGTLPAIFSRHDIEGVIHFAGLKAVGESVTQPLRYYQNNVEGTLNLLDAMAAAGVNTLIFSSSATVYGDPAGVPITEEARRQPTNPYGHTKVMVETILEGLVEATANHQGQPPWKIALLRYFNPIGAHPSGKIGEDPEGTPNNLLPYITQVAAGKLKQLSVFGDDYDTIDGSGVRDYIHVMDLAEGHLSALDWLQGQPDNKSLCDAFNLGTGSGYSVLEVIKAFEKVTGENVPYQVVARRSGDVATCYADASKAKKILGWQTGRDLNEMLKDAWNWQKNNPQGYR